MVHVTEDNVALIDVDLLIHECIKASEGRDAFAYIVSPYIADFPLEPTWSAFVSNIIDVSDTDSYVDLVALLKHHHVDVKVVTKSPRNLEASGMKRWFIDKQSRTLLKLVEAGCEVRTNTQLHAKATITSMGVLSGSFNLTESGRVFNIEAGFYFPSTRGPNRQEYQEKLTWVKEVFAKSTPLSMSTSL